MKLRLQAYIHTLMFSRIPQGFSAESEIVAFAELSALIRRLSAQSWDCDVRRMER